MMHWPPAHCQAHQIEETIHIAVEDLKMDFLKSIPA